MNPAAEKTPILEIVEELQAAAEAPKCHGCGCFHGALQQLSQALPALPEEAREEIRPALEVGAARAIPEEYACLGCAVCWPANALHAASQTFPDAPLGAEAACPTEPTSPERRWPPLPGNYRVLDASGTIAVCVLTSGDLLDALAAARPAGVAIAGLLHTENLGIERLILNTVSNPNISTLLVCGADSKQRIGHLPGQSLSSLVAHGVDARHRIIGALGRRPVLKNLSSEVIASFREEIAVTDRVGEEDLTVVLEVARSLANGPMRRTPSGLIVPGPSVVRAQPPAQFTLDPKGYFILFPDRSRRVVRVEHYENDGHLAHVFEGERPEHLYPTILAHGLVSRLDHAAYLGLELARAEQALRTGIPYVQDRAPEPACSDDCGST